MTTDADALAGIAKPNRASASISINIIMNVEAMFGFVPNGRQGLLEAYWQYSAAQNVAWLITIPLFYGLLDAKNRRFLTFNLMSF